MKIAILGGSGFVGSYLIKEWEREGRKLLIYQRKDPEQPLYWNPETGALDYQYLEGIDILINLSGESINGRWSAEKKEAIIRSRKDSTSFIATAIASLKHPPALWINASAIGYYGNRGDEVLDEHSSEGSGFLPKVVDEWEKATLLAVDKTRVVFTRFGLILGEGGGVLQKMILPFKLGLGGRIGNGRQWYSWVTLADIKGAIEYIAGHPSLKGAVNVVSPLPVTAETFTKTLADVLHRPHLFPLPAWVIRLALGQMGDELLLASTRVVPKKLETTGYKFHDVSLENTLKRLTHD